MPADNRAVLFYTEIHSIHEPRHCPKRIIMTHDQSDQKINGFKETLNLPHTDFPIRANTAIDDLIMIELWQKNNLYEKTFNLHKGGKKFILHDGPPYANGNIHLGSSYNKMLKDILAKAQRMMGKHVPITPGWDCHGLPIELKVTKEFPGLSRQALQKACREYAAGWIAVQKQQFKQLGVLMDWAHPYSTMDASYEADIIRVFGILVEKGYIERKNKTVSWCYHCKTVLASAEIEYYDRKDPSIHVLFPLTQETKNRLFPSLLDKKVSLVIWTTTPWSLPLNRSVLVNPHATYAVLEYNDQFIIVAESLADTLCTLLSIEKKVIYSCKSSDLAIPGSSAHHPFITSLIIPILADQSVELNEGTACVHNAPGAGPIDYEIGIKNGLEIYSPITPDGIYTNDIEPKELAGIRVDDAQGKIITLLMNAGALLNKASIKHSYPHCWRCRNGLIFRATRQWFCNLEKNNFKDRVLNHIDSIKTVPQKSINTLKATIGNRLEWCISRQRVWGTPLVAILCTECDFEYTSRCLIDLVAQYIEQQGIEGWNSIDINSVIPENISCSQCGCRSFKKEQDILDVWFDSGSSNYAVLKKNPELEFPADAYIEGRDQNRGWFQSSILISMIVNNEPPMKTIVTHGYTVDETGRKMSKSLGNVVTPDEIIKKIGVDGLRLWASSIDCSGGDIVISEIIIRNIQEMFRKIRNTCRFLLSNLYDFDIKKDAIPFNSMRVFDLHALQELFELNRTVIKSYNEFDTATVFHAVGDFCTTYLSSCYLDSIKDRLYVEAPSGIERRSAQTVCWYLLDTITRLIAPIVSITADQLVQLYQKQSTISIHEQTFNILESMYEFFQKNGFFKPGKNINSYDALINLEKEIITDNQRKIWDLLFRMRTAILKSIEELRAKGTIKHSLEACIELMIQKDTPDYHTFQLFCAQLDNAGEQPQEFFKEFLIVSQCIFTDQSQEFITSSVPGLLIKVTPAKGNKCPRCWQWEETNDPRMLCSRCARVIVK